MRGYSSRVIVVGAPLTCLVATSQLHGHAHRPPSTIATMDCTDVFLLPHGLHTLHEWGVAGERRGVPWDPRTVCLRLVETRVPPDLWDTQVPHRYPPPHFPHLSWGVFCFPSRDTWYTRSRYPNICTVRLSGQEHFTLVHPLTLKVI